MQIDRSLNLVVPVERADGVVVYVHAAPISRAAFDQNFLLVAKAFTAIYAEGLNSIAGPRVAAKMMRKVASEMGQSAEVESGLFAEMRQLTNVLIPGDRGWTHMPIDLARTQNMIDADDVEEAENAIAFFTLASAMHKRSHLRDFLENAVKLWGAQLTSSNVTGFIASLAMSTRVATTGVKAAPSSTPS